jgi:hypothetical protein
LFLFPILPFFPLSFLTPFLAPKCMLHTRYLVKHRGWCYTREAGQCSLGTGAWPLPEHTGHSHEWSRQATRELLWDQPDSCSLFALESLSSCIFICLSIFHFCPVRSLPLFGTPCLLFKISLAFLPFSSSFHLLLLPLLLPSWLSLGLSLSLAGFFSVSALFHVYIYAYTFCVPVCLPFCLFLHF